MTETLRAAPNRELHNPARRLLALHLLALSLLVCLVVVGHLRFEQVLGSAHDAPPVDAASRQGLLASEIVRLGLELQTLSEPAPRREVAARLADVLERWGRTQAELRRRERSETSDPPNPGLEQALRVLDPDFRGIEGAARALIDWAAAPVAGPFPRAELGKLLAHEKRFARGMDRIVAGYERERANRDHRLAETQRALTLLTLGVLVAITVFVFLPASRLISRAFSRQAERIEEEKKRAEHLRQLGQAARYLAAIVTSSDDAILAETLDGIVTSWNAGAERLYGYSASEVIGRSSEILLPPDGANEVSDILEQIRAGRSVGQYETDHLHRSGHRVRVSLAVSPIRNEDGIIVGASVIARDISERTRWEQALRAQTRELERSNRELEEFASVAAHDLQEPLRKLVSFSQLLRDDLGSNLPERAERDLRFITDAATRMQRLVQDLLALSRAGRLRLKRELLAVDECVDQALAALELRALESGVRIERDPLPKVWADPTLIGTVYQNLLANAFKFAGGSPPQIHLTAERSEQGWVLGVRDSGSGVPPEFHEEIFKPFRRIRSAPDAEGSGIGLALCRRVVECHGGRIWLESAPDGGAHFRFTLGLEAVDEAAQADADEALRSSRRG